MQPITTPNTANKSQETFKKIDDLKPSVSKCYFAILLKSKIFCQRNAHGHGLFNTFIFSPPKNLEKYVCLYHAWAFFFFFKFSLSKICSNMANFPAKRLIKNTAPKIRMRQFFFFQVLFFK